METIEKKDILLRGIPGDVYAAIDQRASRNYRSVTGEVLAILTAVCRGGDTLPGLGVGDVLPDEGAIEHSSTVATDGAGKATVATDGAGKATVATDGAGKATVATDGKCVYCGDDGYCTYEKNQGGGFKCCHCAAFTPAKGGEA